MKYYLLKCENKKGGIQIDPVFQLPSIPYSILDGKSEWMENNKFIISKGTQVNDVLPFDKHFGNMAISEGLKSFLELNEMTGWSCFPIEIDGLKEQYYALQILGRSGGIINLDEVNTSFDQPMKRQIRKSTLDGNDIFLVSGTLNVLITEKVAKKIELEKFTNLTLVDTENTFEFVD
jgi:hypothetical protein